MACSLRCSALAARVLFILFLGTPAVTAAIVVNPALPITHRLDIQIIQTSLTDGSSPATVFGNATQRAEIEADIDLIWAQAGIDVDFLPTITPYANTFAYQGSTLPRPSSDLSTIVSGARTAGKLNPNSDVLNMFFVQVPPGFGQLGPSTSAGIATINGNGMALYTGMSLLTFAGGRDVIAGVVGHEIGHNLGLGHASSGGANLMSPSGTTEQLTPQQIGTVLNSRFLQEAAEVLTGDFTGDGVVNGADLTVWRNAYGENGNGDADGDNDTDGRDVLQWQKHYGAGTLTNFATIPEPASVLLLLACGLTLGTVRVRRFNRR